VGVISISLCGVGLAADDSPPLSGNGDPTNDLPGTLHDFTSTAPVDEYKSLAPDDEGCIACHVGPDLNHEPSVYTGYLVSDSTNYVTVEQPTENTSGLVGPESGVCLDCHDGTVPLGSFAGSSRPNQEMVADAAGNFGTDLRLHHPVSFAYPSDDQDWYNLNPSTGGTGRNSRGDPSELFVKVGDQLFMECVTCHDQHTHYQENNPYNEPYYGSYRWGHFVRMRSICFFCHPRYQDDIDANRKVGVGSDGGQKNEDIGHHLPHRNDPFGLLNGTDGATWDGQHLVGNQKFACVMCHDIDGKGTYGHGHNSACVECHYRWKPDLDDPNAPTAPLEGALNADGTPVDGHHSAGSSRWRPFNDATDDNGTPDDPDDDFPIPETGCYVCHADPVTGRLTGTMYGGKMTPGCGDCHEDRWSEDAPIEVTPRDPFATKTAEPITLSADVMVPGTNTAYTGDIVYQFGFGDGSAPTPLIEVKSTGKVEVEHIYAQAGTYIGFVAVSAEGMSQPTVVEFEVVVEDPDIAEPEDVWAVTEHAPGGDVLFDMTFEAAPGEGGDVLNGVKTTPDGVSSMAIGMKMGNVIFWVDLQVSLSVWGFGNTYFGNILGGDTMAGTVITPAGSVYTYEGELK
jgi:hypothetical protein